MEMEGRKEGGRDVTRKERDEGEGNMKKTTHSCTLTRCTLFLQFETFLSSPLNQCFPQLSIASTSALTVTAPFRHELYGTVQYSKVQRPEWRTGLLLRQRNAIQKPNSI
jgi:hypothetical protein